MQWLAVCSPPGSVGGALSHAFPCFSPLSPPLTLSLSRSLACTFSLSLYLYLSTFPVTLHFKTFQHSPTPPRHHDMAELQSGGVSRPTGGVSRPAGGVPGQRPPVQGRPLCRHHRLPSLHLERTRWIQEELEQPGVPQGPVVPGDR